MSDLSTLALYEGTAGSRRAQDETRRAIHWACGSVRGSDVLDVGCGTGIATILLGREGKTVMGLDRDAEAIELARARLRDEEEAVQRRVRFQVGEAHALPADDASWDAVLLGDLLRRLVDPAGALAEARRLLRPDGQVILTTAYVGGARDAHPDPLFFTETLDLLYPQFAVESFELLGNRVGIAAGLGSGTDGALGVFRQALAVAERRLAFGTDTAAVEDVAEPAPDGADALLGEEHALVAELRQRISQLEERAREARAASEEYAHQLSDERGHLIRLEVQLDGALKQRDRLREALSEEKAKSGERVGRERMLEAEAKRLIGEVRSAEIRVREHASTIHELQLAARQSGRTIAWLEETVRRQEPQVKTLAEIRGSRAYRMMRLLWRLNAAIHRPLRRGSPPPPEPPTSPVTFEAPDHVAPQVLRLPSAAPPKPPRPLTTKQSHELLDIDTDRRRFLAGVLEPLPARKPRHVTDLRVAGVVGTHLADGVGELCELLTFRPDNWRHVLAARPPHLLLVESTFGGNSRSWQHQIADTIHPDTAALGELVASCRSAGIPTAFWFTRDKSETGPFLRAIRHFDHVFSADPSAVEALQAAVGQGVQVRHLPLAGMTPASDSAERNGVVYVGQWPSHWTSDQRGRLNLLLDAALPCGLRILDTGGRGAGGFPERFAAGVEPGHSRRRCVEALAAAKAVIVVGAPEGGLVPGILYDAAAVGTAVVTGPDPLLPAAFEDAVVSLTPLSEAARQLGALLADEPRRAALAASARTALATRHTYRHRIAEIAYVTSLPIQSDG